MDYTWFPQLEQIFFLIRVKIFNAQLMKIYSILQYWSQTWAGRLLKMLVATLILTYWPFCMMHWPRTCMQGRKHRLPTSALSMILRQKYQEDIQAASIFRSRGLHWQHQYFCQVFFKNMQILFYICMLSYLVTQDSLLSIFSPLTSPSWVKDIKFVFFYGCNPFLHNMWPQLSTVASQILWV